MAQEADAGGAGETLHGVLLRVHNTVVEEVMRWAEVVWVEMRCTEVTLTKGPGLDEYGLLRIRAVTRELCWRAMERLQRIHVVRSTGEEGREPGRDIRVQWGTEA